jgi:hypothetical protein
MNCTLEELKEIENLNDPAIAFHGTSSCYSAQIEIAGWPVNDRPFDWAEIEFVMSLAKRMGIEGDGVLGFNFYTQRRRRPAGSGAYFTYYLKGAVQYAGATGGETVRGALRTARHLLEALHEHDEGIDEVDRLKDLVALWERWVFESHPVVYAVKIDDYAFPDDRFPGLVSRSASSFAWQLREMGEIVTKDGDFWAAKSIEPSAILKKVTLASSFIEAF